MPLNKLKTITINQAGATDGQALVWSNSNLQWQPGAGGGGGSMSDVVDDTSPQLGGDLDLLAKNIVGNGNIDINGHFHGTNIELETIEPTLQFKRLNNANVPAIKWLGQAGVEGANITFDGTNGNTNQLAFQTYDGSTLAERFRITYDGVKVTGTIEGASDAELKTSPIRIHSTTINTNTTVASSENAVSGGPVTIASGVTVTVSGDWTVV